MVAEKGELYVVLPTHKEMCDNIMSGSAKLVSNHTIAIAATKVGATIEIYNPPDAQGNISLVEGT